MKEIVSQENCCGCEACAGSCPKNCIHMEEDQDGFWYPATDSERCCECGICRKICPVSQAVNSTASWKEREPKPSAWSAYALDSEIRGASSSGGIFTLLAEEILAQGGVVYGAAFDDKWMVHHVRVEEKEGLAALRGSKYLQSRIGDAYIRAKRDLKQGRTVLFSGVPCQIAGLKKYLGGFSGGNLLCTDILCHGVPSPGVWNRYRNHRQRDFRGKIRDISFRDKRLGWKNFSVRMLTDAGETYRKSMQEDSYMRMFLGNISLRPSCYRCPFKGIPHEADITLGDCWGIKEVCPEMDDDRGTSLVMVQTAKGQEFWNRLQDKVVCRSVSVDEALPPDAESRRPVDCHPGRKRFFKLYRRKASIAELERVLEYTFMQKVQRKLKRSIKEHRIFGNFCGKT